MSNASLPPVPCKSNCYLKLQDSRHSAGQQSLGDPQRCSTPQEVNKAVKVAGVTWHTAFGFLLHAVQTKRKPSTRLSSAKKASLTV